MECKCVRKQFLNQGVQDIPELGQYFLLFVLRDFFQKIESGGGGQIKIKIKSTFW